MPQHGLMSTYSPLPVSFVRGEGVWLYDNNDKQYYDAIGGIAVCGLGHCHPEVTKTIQQQAATLVHTSNLYQIGYQQALGEKLSAVSGMDACFFSNSGAEANECAIKLARLWGHEKGIEIPEIIVADGAFHGRTMATLSATGNHKVQAGFAPLVQGFVRAPFNDIQALESLAKAHPNVVAVMIEPVQGEGGIHIASDDYLAAVRALCDAQGWLLIFDEIQTGNGRTGKYFAYQHLNLMPDVVTTAKGLGNGLPIGACLARGQAAELFKPGNHGSTYGGNPLCCATALTVVNTIVDNKLPDRAQWLGQRLLERFKSELAGLDKVKEIRGKGLMIGIEMTESCTDLVKIALAEGLLINVTADRVIRLLPALTTTDEEAETLVTKVATLIRSWAV